MIRLIQGKLAGFMASPASGYLAVATLAGLIGLFWLWRGAVDDLATAHRDIGRLANISDQYAASLSNCQGTVLEYRQAAELNLQAAAQAEQRARHAEAVAINLRHAARQRIEGIRHDETAMRNTSDETCRLLTDPLPDAFLKWVWNDTAQGNH